MFVEAVYKSLSEEKSDATHRPRFLASLAISAASLSRKVFRRRPESARPAGRSRRNRPKPLRLSTSPATGFPSSPKTGAGAW